VLDGSRHFPITTQLDLNKAFAIYDGDGSSDRKVRLHVEQLQDLSDDVKSTCVLLWDKFWLTLTVGYDEIVIGKSIGAGGFGEVFKV